MYKIEITADTVSELAGRIAALNAEMNGSTAIAVVEVAAAETKAPAKRASKAKAEAPAAEQGNAEAADTASGAADADNAPDEVGKSDANATSSETAETSGPEAAGEDETSGTAEIADEEIDFDKEITPRVLQLATTKGREATAEVIGRFGAARASLVPQASWPDLLAALKSELGE